jgi:hypothetical protein
MENNWSKHVVTIDPREIVYDANGTVDLDWLLTIDPSGAIDPDHLLNAIDPAYLPDWVARKKAKREKKKGRKKSIKAFLRKLKKNMTAK